MRFSRTNVLATVIINQLYNNVHKTLLEESKELGVKVTL